MDRANGMQYSLFAFYFWGKVAQVNKLEQKHLAGFVLLIPMSGMQMFQVNISWFFESLPDNKCSTDLFSFNVFQILCF